MNKFNILFLTLAICASLAPKFALGEEEANPQLEAKVQAVKSLLTVSTLRDVAAKNTADAVKAALGNFIQSLNDLKSKLAGASGYFIGNDNGAGATLIDTKNKNNNTEQKNVFKSQGGN